MPNHQPSGDLEPTRAAPHKPELGRRGGGGGGGGGLFIVNDNYRVTYVPGSHQAPKSKGGMWPGGRGPVNPGRCLQVKVNWSELTGR